ncbi:hypothetical protein HD595_005325 [Nonomuraea roseoviolacea subsp. carminata]|uniref:Uncharacterized protein n=1 Tax=Nonomuraea roseoviolacea subsp. carminata TaxID=160689 RepID=A0ABT1K5C2_9ACTN|nr:hypothetical protein [Nonomuraea roseoviolacea subsp. carminata]
MPTLGDALRFTGGAIFSRDLGHTDSALPGAGAVPKHTRMPYR